MESAVKVFLDKGKKKKKTIQTSNIPAGMQATITQFHILFYSISFDRLS